MVGDAVEVTPRAGMGESPQPTPRAALSAYGEEDEAKDRILVTSNAFALVDLAAAQKRARKDISEVYANRGRTGTQTIANTCRATICL